MAKDFDLLVSGGSDFHGSRFKKIELGIGYGNLQVSERLLEPLRRAAHGFPQQEKATPQI